MSEIKLTADQEVAVNAMIDFLDGPEDDDVFTLSGVAGAGKAQPLTSRIYTPEGFKLMGDIEKGDKVLTKDGVTQVTGVFPQGVRDIYQINFSDDSSTRCCKEHLWNVIKRGRVNKTLSLEEIERDYIYTDPHGNSRKVYQVPLSKAHFNKKRLPINPYTLGCLIGDGSMTGGSVGISTADTEILDNLKKELPDFSFNKRNNYDYVITDIGNRSNNKRNNRLISDLRDLMLFGCTSYNKFIPSIYLMSSIEDRVELLKGLMDTDGTICKVRNSTSYSTSSKLLKDSIVFLVRSLGGTTRVRSRYPKYHYKDELLTSKHINYNISINTPNDIGAPFKLSRKSDLWKPKTKYQPKRYITDITLLGEEEVQCIKVEDKSSLYLTDDFIVTHNTFSVKEALRGRSNIVGAVISHAAKAILGKSLEGVASCITVAQLLGLVMRYQDDGEISFTPSANRRPGQVLPIDSAEILIIDECSMIDEELHGQIMRMKRPGAKVIYMGDVYQLAPIGSDTDSITFNFTKATLNNAVRYTGPIADLGNRIKAEIDKCNADEPAVKYVLNEWMGELGHNERTSKVNKDGSGYIFLNDIQDVINIATTAFKESEDPEAMKLLAYRNSNISKLNDVIRAQTHGCEEYMVDGVLKLPQFVKGELIICDGGYSVQVMAPTGHMMTHNLIYNNQTFKVLDTMDVDGPVKVPKHGEEHEEIPVPSLSMSLSPALNIPDGTEVYVMDYKNVVGRRSYFDHVNRLKKRAQDNSNSQDWRRYYSFLANFAEFKYNYAQTCHRSQGGTYEDVIVFDNDITSISRNKLKSKLQALYVSCTRARRRVYIYNLKTRVNQEELPAEIRKELGI